MINVSAMTETERNSFAMGANSPYSNHFPGVNVEGCNSVADVLDTAKANFEVGLIPLFSELDEDPTGMMPYDSSEPFRIGYPEFQGTYRKDSGATLGVVGTGYEPIQNIEAFDVLDHLIMQGHAKPLGCHVKDGGKSVRIFSSIGGAEIDRLTENGTTRKDMLGHFVDCRTGHTGSDAVEFILYTICLICLNGMTTRTKETHFSIRHTKNARERLVQANEAIKKIHDAAEKEAAVYGGLAQRGMTTWDFRQFADNLLNMQRGKLNAESSQNARTRRENDLSTLLTNFVSGPGNHGASQYDAYNSVTQWLTPDRNDFTDPLKFEAKWESQSSGVPANRMKGDALQLLTRGVRSAQAS